MPKITTRTVRALGVAPLLAAALGACLPPTDPPGGPDPSGCPDANSSLATAQQGASPGATTVALCNDTDIDYAKITPTSQPPEVYYINQSVSCTGHVIYDQIDPTTGESLMDGLTCDPADPFQASWLASDVPDLPVTAFRAYSTVPVGDGVEITWHVTYTPTPTYSIL